MGWQDLEREQTQLELWGRHDGVPLLMRVVHILQIKALPSVSLVILEHPFQ